MAEYDLTDDDLIDEASLPTSESRPLVKSDFDHWIRSGEWVGVDSSWCRAIRFRRRDMKLLVRFKDGFVAGYDVPMNVVGGMWRAESKGKYVHAQLYRLPYTDETHAAD